MPTQMPRHTQEKGTKRTTRHKHRPAITKHYEFNRGSRHYDAQQPQPKLFRQIQSVLTGIRHAPDVSEKTTTK